MGTEVELDELRGFDSYEVKLGDQLRGERATLGKSLLDVQRELRIRAAYIAAIENCDIEVFPNPGFVAGYARSYARYLNLDPDDVFRRFCEESGFGGVNAGLQARKSSNNGRIIASGPVKLEVNDPLFKSVLKPGADLSPGIFEQLSASSVGSLLVLMALTLGVGYGGYQVLQNVQRVTIAPVDQRPETLSSVTGLTPPGLGGEELALSDVPSTGQPADADLARLYQPRELEVPVVEVRDGPIVDIDPRQAGLFPQSSDEVPLPDVALADLAEEVEKPQVREPVGAPVVNVVARQPAWVRVYLADGSVLFEKILDPGETYTLPLDVDAPLLRAGNSGAVYLLVNDEAFGPLGSSSSVAKDVSLLPADIRTDWPEVSDPPEVIQASVIALDQAAPAE